MSDSPLQSPYLRNQRSFPTEDVKGLSSEMDKAYIDIAGNVNLRIIGIFALNFNVITGESWYFKGQSKKQQSLRQIFTFTATGSIPHNLNFQKVSLISPRCYGTFTDSTNWYGVIYAGSLSIMGQVSFYVTPTNIVVISGAGAPAITSGTIILEWVSNF
jgi:hypothetical protein